jgi:glycerol-3-phosphate acyltransferase PlsY
MVFLLLAATYIVASVPVSYLLARGLYGIDLRECGSGNIGVSNLAKATSYWTVVPAVAFDMAKGAVPVWVAHLLGIGILGQAGVGLAAVIAHNWPLFLRFNGGRGVMTTLAVTLALPLVNGYFPWEIMAFLLLTGILLLLVHSTPIAVEAAIAATPLVSWLSGKPLAMTLSFLAMFLLLVCRRLLVPRSLEGAGVSRPELLFNRLFLDRDIRDGRAWVNRGLNTAECLKHDRPKSHSN